VQGVASYTDPKSCAAVREDIGFTHYCANGRDGGGFILGRKPVRTRMRSKLREIKGHLQVDVRSFLIFGRWVLC
jgi:hypothetical protein